MQTVAGKTITEWQHTLPLLTDIQKMRQVLWHNSRWQPTEAALESLTFSRQDVIAAEQRLARFAPYIERMFPETKHNDGLIESPLRHIAKMKDIVMAESKQTISENLLLKSDNELAISGSIKARGGIYEVLRIAESVALRAGLLYADEDYSIMAEPQFCKLFSQYQIVVGSTGNLGLSIGIMGVKMGFQVTVHMSRDAKQWKKDKLRAIGATVVEYESDYTAAVEHARQAAKRSENVFFIDDENSTHLFLGYATAASRLQRQLQQLRITVDADHPLVVYLPCGVGGGPGGIAFGLKLVFGDSVYVYFAEPTHSPSMLLGLLTQKHSEVSVHDFGLDNITAADGLAVGRPSHFVGRVIEHLIDGVYTVSDDTLYRLQSMLADAEGVAVETSAAAGLFGPLIWSERLSISDTTVRSNTLKSTLRNATQIVWATGGSMVPHEVMKVDYEHGKALRRGTLL